MTRRQPTPDNPNKPSTAKLEKIFAILNLWMDETPREGPAQMACDEALLRLTDRPVLRVFRWANPWISAGYFVPFDEAQAARPDLPVCRRWTGGGIVIHDNDFTFSLIAPRGEVFASQRPADSYRLLHEALAAALALTGCASSLADDRSSAGRECFAAPVQHDILCDGKKIAGGAQRRSKHGLLHQGSVQSTNLGPEGGKLVAHAMAEKVAVLTQAPEEVEREAERLTLTKYANESFLRRV